MIEYIYSAFGYRKFGTPLEQREDDRDWKASDHLDYKVGAELARGRDFINLETIETMDQGLTAWCVAFAIAHALTIMIRLEYKISAVIEGKTVAKELIDAGILTKNGAYILDAIKHINNVGVYDNTGKLWKTKGFAKVDRTFDAFFQTLLLGHPVILGGMVGSPYRDFNWFWLPSNTRDGGGHCEVGASAYKQREIRGTWFERVVGKLNSWHRWGLRKHGKSTGVWFIDEKSMSKLFTPYCFLGVEPT